MTEEKAQEVKKKLSTKTGGDLWKLFYTKRGMPKQKLYTYKQMREKLGIPEGDNLFENEGIDYRLRISVSQLRNDAKRHGINFVDFKIEKADGHDIYYHGFVQDIDKINQTIELYNQRVEKSREIYKMTLDVAQSQIKLIEQK